MALTLREKQAVSRIKTMVDNGFSLDKIKVKYMSWAWEIPQFKKFCKTIHGEKSV